MKEYKVTVYREGMLGSFFFGAAKINPEKFTLFLNKNASEGWRVITMEKDIQRMFLFFRREAYAVVLERDK
jgi:hypothetical protein